MTESRWATELAQHPFQMVWKMLKGELVNVEIDDQTVPTSVYELARLKRVVIYLDQIIKSLDPDLTPKAIWSSFQQQAEGCLNQVRAYASDKNIGHIVSANDHADNLLTYVRPYQVIPEDALRALSSAAGAYSAQLNEYVEAFRVKAGEIVGQLSQDKKAGANSLKAAEKDSDKIKEFSDELFVGSPEVPAISNKIRELLEVAVDHSKSIDDLHAVLLVGTAKEPSTQAKVKVAEGEISTTHKNLLALLDGVGPEVSKLEEFHQKIFGKVDEGTGKMVGGLESELSDRMTDLGKAEHEQGEKHAALVDKIESLLPGATSAGLASAYKSLKDNFEKPIGLYTKLFYGSLSILILAALVMAIKEVSIYPAASIAFVDTPDWDVIFKALLYKAPFIIPVIWLALFSSTRRSQYERLQQEYAHKEALATSYESYKKQLQDLKGDTDALQRELISKAIDAVAYNASVTLDGKHQEKLPTQQLLEKLNFEELKKLVELIKNAKPA